MNKNFTFKFSSCLFVLGAVALLSAQTQVENSDFEVWRMITVGSKTFNVPTHWNNINNAKTGFLTGTAKSQQTILQSTDLPPGSTDQFSVEIVTTQISVLGSTSIVNGTLTTGQMNATSITPSDGYTQTLAGNSDFSQPFIGKPTAITFWAKYSVTGSGDNARISAIIHDNYNQTDPIANDPNKAGMAHVVAIAQEDFQTDGEWKQITVPFDYSQGQATDPQYMLLTLSSSAVPGQGINGATLLVNNIQMVYGALDTNDATFDQFSYYPNPLKNQINLKSPQKIQKVDLFNMNGQQVLTVKPQALSTSLDTTSLVPGVYIMNVMINGKQNTYKIVRQ